MATVGAERRADRMTENEARNVLLVRACETAPAGEVPWSAEDRIWASRAAAEVEGESAPTERYVARRAVLALERLSARDRSVRRVWRTAEWRPWIGWALPLVALGAGLLTDAIGPTQRVNVLAPPLLALMGWNLLVYVAIALRTVAVAFGAKARPGRIAHLLVRTARRVSSSHAASAAEPSALARFAADWARAGGRLNASRVARVLHVSAIAFAIGALTGMYVRGLALEFRAGWESTFLGAATLQMILSTVLGPASALSGIALPDVARLEAMRFPESSGEHAASWIHLYALTVALVVVVPRSLLAAANLAIERRLERSLPLPLDDAYFAALAREYSGDAAVVTVVSSNHTMSPQATLTLRAMLDAVLGSNVKLSVEPTIAYGDEDTVTSRVASTPAPALVLATMSSSATPEAETHGVFLERLAAALPAGARLLPLIDESAFLARFGGDDATAVRRRDERRLAWRKLLAARELQPLFIDLEHADPLASARKLRDALDRPESAAAATAPQ